MQKGRHVSSPAPRPFVASRGRDRVAARALPPEERVLMLQATISYEQDGSRAGGCSCVFLFCRPMKHTGQFIVPGQGDTSIIMQTNQGFATRAYPLAFVVCLEMS